MGVIVDGGSTVEEVEASGGDCGQDRVARERVEMGLIDNLVGLDKMLLSKICEVWSSLRPRESYHPLRPPLGWRLLIQQY